MNRHRRETGAPIPRGFSIVELVVAMMLVSVGVLSLVGANAVFVRRRNEARQRLLAITAVSNRVAQLSSNGCLAAIGTASSTSGITELWSVVPRADATRDIVDSVRFGLNPSHALVVRTRLPC